MVEHSRPLTMYGQVADLAALDWGSVEDRLVSAPLYWVVAATDGWPHPRPVWGVWHESMLFVSVGSPGLVRALAADGRVTVHLESATDVVVVEGWAATTALGHAAVERYNAKYEYEYDEVQYGPLICVTPRQVLAWTTAGVAGRDGFRSGGSWTLTSGSQHGKQREVVEEYFEGFRVSDHGRILNTLAVDVVWVIHGHRTTSGKAEFDAEIENPAFTGSPQLDVDRILEMGNVVVVTGEGRGVSVEHGPFRFAFNDLFTFRDGLIARVDSYVVPMP